MPQLVVETEIGFDLDVRIGFGDFKAIEITRGGPVENRAIAATDNRDVGHDRRRVQIDVDIQRVVTGNIRVETECPAFVLQVLGSTKIIVGFDFVEVDRSTGTAIINCLGHAVTVVGVTLVGVVCYGL